MKSYRTKLFFGLLSLIFIVLISLGLLLGELFKSYYSRSIDSRMVKEADLIAEYIRNSDGNKDMLRRKMEIFSESLDSRISIVSKEGDILFDSREGDDTNFTPYYETIRQIVAENSIRNSNEKYYEAEGGNNLRFYWSTIEENGQVTGYVFLSVKLNEIKDAYKQIWWILIVSLGLALIIIMIIGARITERYTKPIESATKVAYELARGNYRARTYEGMENETGMLSTSINVLARNLQEMVKAREIQQDRLTTLIENMGTGLILVDSRGYITLINRTYKETFRIKEEDYIGHLYYDAIRHKEISNLIEEIFMTEQKVHREIIISLDIERRYFDVYGVPIIGTNDDWKGILLVFHDITEMKKLEQMRKDFVANVSHELKTPITSIKGFSETLLDGAMNDKDTLEAFLKIILTESERLQNLVHDLLELSKIEQHGNILSFQNCNMVSLIEDILPILEKRAEEKRIELVFEKSDEAACVEGDEYRLKQVFVNLITNAINYTPDGGKVTVSYADEADSVSVSVKDTGIGIDKKELPRIFERFYRVDKARNRSSGGTGLGLAIVKHIVEAHHGEISVESELGKGTIFTVKLFKDYLARKRVFNQSGRK